MKSEREIKERIENYRQNLSNLRNSNNQSKNIIARALIELKWVLDEGNGVNF